MTDRQGVSAFDVKACCAVAYGSQLMHLLLGERLHPGGHELTRRLADLTGIGPGDRVLDVASGLGTTARLLSSEREATVRGVELSPRLVKLAERDAVEAGLGKLVRFEVGDAERLRVEPGSFDVVLCECALCTFPDQEAALAGFRRALGPGGRVGIADVTLERGRLPAELDTPIGRVVCVAGALSASGYERLLRQEGFTDVVVEPHPEAALATVDSIGDGLGGAREWLRGLFDVDEALRLVDLARDAVRGGSIGYALMTAKVEEGPTASPRRGPIRLMARATDADPALGSAGPVAPRAVRPRRSVLLGAIAGLVGIGCCVYPVALVLLGLSSAVAAVDIGNFLFDEWGWAFRSAGAAFALAALWAQRRLARACPVDARPTFARNALLIAATALGTYAVVYGVTTWLGTLAG